MSPSKKTLKGRPGSDGRAGEIEELRARLAELEETLEAIRTGAVDAPVVSGPEGDQVFALKGAETPYRLLVEAMHEAAVILDAEGTILYCNGRLATMAQCPQGYPTGKRLRDFVMAEQGDALKQMLAAVPPEGCRREFWLRPQDPAGKPLPVQFAARRLQLDDAECLVVIATDLATQKAYEAVLQRSNEELDERTSTLQEMVGELEYFSYTITHDMRAPLRALQGFADLVEKSSGEGLKPEISEYLDLIKSSAKRMDRLITDALQYNKAGKQEMPMGPVDVGASLRGIVQAYPSMQPPQAIIRIEGDIPKVLGNEAGLTQCFSNLLGNAVKFVPPGKVPEVRVFAESRDGFVRLWFEDNGIGIPERAQGKLFQLFQRATRKFEGTGVGLALVRKVTERMGGRVGVESTVGQGSRFWMDLRAAA